MQPPRTAPLGHPGRLSGLVAVALLLAACEGGVVVIRGEVPPPRPAVGVLRVKEIRAEEVRARAIYAKEVEAARIQAGRIVRVPEREAKGWGGREKLRAAAVHADEIYATKIEARIVVAGVLYVHELEWDD